MVMSFALPFAASAADSAKFKICVESQNDKNVTVTIDFESGKGFNALDVSIKYNKLKLSLEDCQFASGFAAFKKYVEEQNGMTIFTVNKDENPINVSIASTVSYKMLNNDGSIIKLKFSKIEGANISKDDISLAIGNCQDADYNNIGTSVSYALTEGSSSSASDETAKAGELPKEPSAPQTTTQDSEEPQEGEATAADSGENGASDKNQNTTSASQSVTEADAKSQKSEQSVKNAEKKLSNRVSTWIFIAIGVILVAAVVLLITAIIKNKKSGKELDS